MTASTRSWRHARPGPRFCAGAVALTRTGQERTESTSAQATGYGLKGGIRCRRVTERGQQDSPQRFVRIGSFRPNKTPILALVSEVSPPVGASGVTWWPLPGGELVEAPHRCTHRGRVCPSAFRLEQRSSRRSATSSGRSWRRRGASGGGATVSVGVLFPSAMCVDRHQRCARR